MGICLSEGQGSVGRDPLLLTFVRHISQCSFVKEGGFGVREEFHMVRVV